MEAPTEHDPAVVYESHIEYCHIRIVLHPDWQAIETSTESDYMGQKIWREVTIDTPAHHLVAIIRHFVDEVIDTPIAPVPEDWYEK